MTPNASGAFPRFKDFTAPVISLSVMGSGFALESRQFLYMTGTSSWTCLRNFRSKFSFTFLVASPLKCLYHPSMMLSSEYVLCPILSSSINLWHCPLCLCIRRWNKALSDCHPLIISVFSRCLLLAYSIQICLRNSEVFSFFSSK